MVAGGRQRRRKAGGKDGYADAGSARRQGDCEAARGGCAPADLRCGDSRNGFWERENKSGRSPPGGRSQGCEFKIKFKMQVRSTYRYAKISPFKVREVTRAIQGLPVSAALDLVAFSPKKAAGLIAKTLKSAVANAENNANLRVDGLVVKEATVGEGPTMKRMMTRARGSGSRILKRSSHIRIILTDEIEIKTREKRNAEKKKTKKVGGKK